MADELPAFIETEPGNFKALWAFTYDELAAYVGALRGQAGLEADEATDLATRGGQSAITQELIIKSMEHHELADALTRQLHLNTEPPRL
jgi:hypothetical protein